MNQLPRLLACLVVAIVIVMAGLAGPPAWAERPHDETRDAVNDARSDRQDFPDSPSESAMVDAARFSDDTVQKLDEVVAREMQEKNLPGVVVGVWVPGEGRYLVARGVANLETGRPRRLHDPFRIASITKTFTATAILQLIDKGKLSKSDTVSKWLPDFTNADLITVEYLLRMRSGIADSADEELLKYYYDHPLVDFPAEASIKRAASKADQFEAPDQKTKYTNVNYNILEVIIEKVTGRDISAQITRSILKPLGMRNSLYPIDRHLPGKLRGYGWNAQTGEFEDKTRLNPSLPGGAGAVISNLRDLKIYTKALCAGGLLKPETQAARLETMPLEGLPEWIGYGEGVGKISKFCGHNGTIMGFSSEMWYLPEKDAVIVINVNRLDADDQTQSSNLFFAIAKILFPEYVNW